MCPAKLKGPEKKTPSAEQIFISTVFKSGTKLLERIIAELTGLSVNTPPKTTTDYDKIYKTTIDENTFFIWHNFPSEEVKAELEKKQYKVIFLVRNIYDLLVSQYHHFLNDVDRDIGHDTHTEKYFNDMGQDAGISLLISGATSKHFDWKGFSYILIQIQEMLKLSKEKGYLLIVYDRLIDNKPKEIIRIAKYLKLRLSAQALANVLHTTDLDQMRQDRIRQTGTGSGEHFRIGKPREHINTLNPWHYHMINNLIRLYAPDLVPLCHELGFGDILSAPLDDEIYAFWSERN